MCGRYYIDELDASFEELLEQLNRRPAGDQRPLASAGEIRPMDYAPVIANSRRLEAKPFVMQWGFSGFGASKRPVINARSETAASSGMFGEPMKTRRCLIPASHYFEWQHMGRERIRHAVALPGERMMMAGVYRFEADRALPVFAILTREAAPQIAHIHSRMPVIVPESLCGAWLSADADAQAVLAAAQTYVVYGAVM